MKRRNLFSVATVLAAAGAALFVPGRAEAQQNRNSYFSHQSQQNRQQQRLQQGTQRAFGPNNRR